MGNMTKETRYGRFGNILKQINYEYDSAGNMTKETSYVPMHLTYFVSYRDLAYWIEYDYITITPHS